MGIKVKSQLLFREARARGCSWCSYSKKKALCRESSVVPEGGEDEWERRDEKLILGGGAWGVWAENTERESSGDVLQVLTEPASPNPENKAWIVPLFVRQKKRAALTAGSVPGGTISHVKAVLFQTPATPLHRQFLRSSVGPSAYSLTETVAPTA